MPIKTTTLLALFLLLLLLAAVATACDDVDCENVDTGSCGNACCRLEVAFESHSTEEVRDALLKAFGGADGRYTAQMTAEGTLGFGDLRPFNASADFIGQAWHLTKNEMYNDTVNFALYPNDDGSTTATAFSISQTAGAFGDDGQNYYNLVTLLKAAFDGDDSSAYSIEHPDASCPEPTTTQLL